MPEQGGSRAPEGTCLRPAPTRRRSVPYAACPRTSPDRTCQTPPVPDFPAHVHVRPLGGGRRVGSDDPGSGGVCGHSVGNAADLSRDGRASARPHPTAASCVPLTRERSVMGWGSVKSAPARGGAGDDPHVDALGASALQDAREFLAGAASRQYVVHECDALCGLRGNCNESAAQVAAPCACSEGRLIRRCTRASAQIHPHRQRKRAPERTRKLQRLVEPAHALLGPRKRDGHEHLRQLAAARCDRARQELAEHAADGELALIFETLDEPVHRVLI